MTIGGIEIRYGEVARFLLVALAMALVGCASLAKLPEDTPDERRRKIVSRVFLGIGTFGISEAFVHPKQNRILAARRNFEYGVHMTRTLAKARTLDELIRFFGADPRCKQSGEATQTCTWHFDTWVYGMTGPVFYGYYFAAWRARPVQIGRDVLVVICTLPRDGSAREPGSCSHSTPDGLQREGYLLECHARHTVYCSPDSRGRRF